MAVLADTSVWVDHLRLGDARLAVLLEAGEIMIHAFVIGEVALGSLAARTTVLALLDGLEAARSLNRRRFGCSSRDTGCSDAESVMSMRI